MMKELNMFNDYKVEEVKNMKRLSLYNLKIVKEKTVSYNAGLNEKVIGPEKIHSISIEALEMQEQTVESFYIFTLTTKNTINGIFEVSRGSLNASIVHPRDVFQRAILQNANSIILMHNHPSGDPTPSDEDINVTNRLVEAGHLLGIKVMDHIIVGDEERYVSFKAQDLI